MTTDPYLKYIEGEVDPDIFVLKIAKIEGYPNYEIHYCNYWEAKGMIWSVRKERYIKPKKDKYGYYKVRLYKNNIQKELKIHRLLIQYFKPDIWNPELVVNHINYKREDNTLENLEMVSMVKNTSNRDKSKCASKYQGIMFSKKHNKWRAKCYVDGKHKHIGYFINQKDAARARDAYIINNELDRSLNNISDDDEE